MAGELIPYKGGAMTEWIEARGRLSSYDESERPGKLAVYMAMQGADAALDDMIGQTVEVVHIVCHPAQLVNPETGEMRETIRTVLIGADGRRVSTHSETARRCVQRYAEVFQEELPFSPPARFRVVKQPRKGKPGGYLQLVPEELLEVVAQAEAKKKGKGKSDAQQA